jgi:peptide/nickel transport system substrate-binding protein
MKSIGRLFLIPLVAAGLLLSAPPGSALAQQDTLTVLVPASFPNVDPGESVSGDQNMIVYHVFSRLYTFTEKMEPVPDLVTSESVSDDGTVWTFEIKAGVKFHDGTPLNSEAVKYTVDRMLTKGGSQRALFALIKEVRIHGDTRFSLVTGEPFPSLRNNLAHPESAIVSPTADKRLGKDFGLKPVGSGPYKFTEWVTGDHITLDRFDGYDGDKPFFKRILFKFVTDDTTRALLMETGEADVALRPLPNDAARLAKRNDLAVRQVPARNILYQLNMTKKPFNDKRVRLAINYAVDKEAIIDRILGGAGEPAHSLVEAVQGTIDAGYYAYNPDKARALLKEAGAEGAEVVLLSPTTRYPLADEVSQAVAGYLRQVGLNVKVNVMGDWPAYLEQVKQHNFDLFMLGWGGSTGDPDNAYRRLLQSQLAGKYWNVGSYLNPKVDDLIVKGSQEFDSTKRMQYYADLQRIAWDDAVWLFMYRASSFVAYRSEIKGIRLLPGTEMPYFWLARR